MDLKTPKGLIAFIFFPTIIFIIMELWQIKKEIEKETEKRLLKKWQALKEQMHQPTSIVV